MPRTKRPANKRGKSFEHDDSSVRYTKLVAECNNMIDTRLQTELRNFEVAFKLIISSIKNENLQMTVGQLKNELYLRDVPNTQRTRHSSRSALNDDAAPMTRGLGTIRRSRSASASSRKQPQTAAKQVNRRRSRSVYQTPAYNKNALVNYPVITPKVTPHTPLTVLRQPRLGEMVVSMSGSPVMVPTCYTMQQNEQANCNILLNDGTMLSLQPKHLRESQAYIPFSLMNSQVLDQLKTLKENLGKVVELGERSKKVK